MKTDEADIESDEAEDEVGEVPIMDRSLTSRQHKETIGRPASASGHGKAAGPVDNRVYLSLHKKERDKNDEVRALIRNGIKQNRFCRMLDDEDLDIIIESMEYFAFDTGEHVVKQGYVGYYFFVTQDGSFEVDVNGKLANELSPGTAFGAIAILHACARTATVKAKTPGSVWGADAETFRKVLLANAQKHHDENRQFLDCIRLFDGLAEDQKERVGKLALFAEHFNAGARVQTQGEKATAIYLIKKGELNVIVGGSCDANGVWQGGENTSQLKAGDLFGEHQVLYDEPLKATIVVESDCDLLGIGARQLKLVLGENVSACLERGFIMSTLRKLPMINHLSLTQQSAIAQEIEIRPCQAGESVQKEDDNGMQLVMVVDGSISGTKQGAEITVQRGEWCGDDAFGTDDGNESRAPSRAGNERKDSKEKKGFNRITTRTLTQTSGCSTIDTMVAGPQGARVALLSSKALVKALHTLGLAALGHSDQCLDYMRQVLCAKKVPIFHSLSPAQIDSFVNSFVMKSYNAGAIVIKEGDIGTEFFIISKGSVNVTISGRTVRTLATNSCFGERALLFNERRSASVEVAENGTDLWCISKAAFDDVISENMQKELEYRIKLQDTTVSMKLIKHVRLIGAGAFGSVRLVEHKFTGLRYALKRIKKVDGEVPLAVTQECELLAEMDHPFILQLVQTFKTNDSIYILTELITGGQMHEQMQKTGVLNRKKAQFYVGSLVLILEYLHDKCIIYRDLKPENVMLDPQGYLKLVDFGLAKKLDGNTYTLAGSLFYMAPEVFEGHGYNLAVDIWSLGIMLYEFVCGCMPYGEGAEYDGDIITSIMQDNLVFPGKFNDSAGKKLIQGMLTRDAAARLGAGVDGFKDIKDNKYFKAGCSGDIFMKILGRELQAPIVPGPDEVYSEIQKLEATVTLSDADELCDSD